MIYLAVPHDSFNELIEYLDQNDRFHIDASKYVKDDSEVVLYLSDSGKDDSLVVDTPNEDKVTFFLVNDMTKCIRGMIDDDRGIV